MGKNKGCFLEVFCLVFRSYILLMQLFCLDVFMCTILMPGASGGQMKASDFLGLDSETAPRLSVGSGNQIIGL